VERVRVGLLLVFNGYLRGSGSGILGHEITTLKNHLLNPLLSATLMVDTSYVSVEEMN
jgi:hypothetical protein